MVNKIICCSFEKGSMGGFMTISNGVRFSKDTHYSKTVAITREAFIAACKDRVLFNDILGVDIRNGWQNALSAAIECFKNIEENFDPSVALKASTDLDIKIRGEDAVQKDIETLEKNNEEIDKAISEERAKKAEKRKSYKKAKKNDTKPTEGTDNSGENAGNNENTELPADGTGTECNE